MSRLKKLKSNKNGQLDLVTLKVRIKRRNQMHKLKN